MSAISQSDRDASSHRRGDPKRLMDPGEVVVHEVQGDGAMWFSSFFQNPFVSRVNRRMCIRIVRFWRST